MSIHRTALAARASRSTLSERAIRAMIGASHRLAARLREDRGDVPGWVLITLMTAGIVVALWAVASKQIVGIFEAAMAPFLDGRM